MTSLKITLIQQNIIWHDRQANLHHLGNLLNHSPVSDIYVLPEMFTSGFSMSVNEQSDTMDGESILWMKRNSNLLNAAICGSIMIKESDNFYNRFIFCLPDGTIYHYDKKHLFRMATENEVYTSGKNRLVIDYKGWKIAPIICYDLRFPVFIRRTPQFDYDLLIAVANWPDKRSEHWKALLTARAIENQAYVVGVNRVGVDDLGITYAGDSKVILPWGEDLCVLHGSEQVHQIILHQEAVNNYREQFPVHLDNDLFQLN